MTHILKLLSGDRGNPTNELDLNQLTAGEIRLTSGGLVPNPGQLNVLYTGESIRYNGELPVKESRGNMRLELRYNISGGSSADISRIQREITQFLRDAKLYNQDGQGDAVWLEYRWNTNTALDDLPRPTWGQLNYYAEILSADDVRWPDNIHEQGYLNGNFVEGVICTLTCKPHWYGLEQRCITTPGLMDVTDQYNTTLSGVDFSGEWSISFWFENTDGLADNNVAFRYYVGSNDDISVYQNLSADIVCTFTVSGSSTTKLVAGNTNAPNHVIVVQSASIATLYVNGVAAATSFSANAWGSGTIYIGCYDVGGGGKETTTTIDGFRIWENETLTAAQVAALYTEEKAIKDAGGWVGKPPYLYTYNATNKIYRGNSTNSGGYNCAIVGNVNGSGVDALAMYEIDTANVSGARMKLWLGRKHYDTAPTLTDSPLTYNFSGGGSSAADNDSHSNAHRTDTWDTSGNDGTVFYSSFTRANFPDGRYLVLCRMMIDGADCLAHISYAPVDTSASQYFDDITVSHHFFDYFGIIEFYDVVTKKPFTGTIPTRGLSLVVSQQDTTAATAKADFLQLIPYPYVTVSSTLSSNSEYTLEMDAGNVQALNTSGATVFKQVLGHAEGVTLEPGKYNLLVAQFGNDDYSNSVYGTYTASDVDADYITITTYVIPRWLLPGGLVA